MTKKWREPRGVGPRHFDDDFPAASGPAQLHCSQSTNGEVLLYLQALFSPDEEPVRRGVQP